MAIVCPLWYWYDKTGIVLTGGFSFTSKFGHTQISVRSIIVTYTPIKNILHQFNNSSIHREWLNTGAKSNQKKNQFVKWRPNISFYSQNKFTHFKEKVFPLNTTKTAKEKVLPWKQNLSFVAILGVRCVTQKEYSKRHYSKLQKSI